MRIKIFWSILQKSNKRWRLPYNPLLKESYYVSINQTFCVFFSPKSYWWGQQSVFPCKKSPKLTQQVHLEAGLHRGGDVVVGGAAAEHTVHIMPAQWRSFSLLFQRTPNFLPILKKCTLFVHTPSSCVKIIWAECAAAKSSTNLWEIWFLSSNVDIFK